MFLILSKKPLTKLGRPTVLGSRSGLGEFVRKLDADALDDAFVDTFRTLLAFGLRRDQNVFSLALWNRYGRGTADAAPRPRGDATLVSRRCRVRSILRYSPPAGPGLLRQGQSPRGGRPLARVRRGAAAHVRHGALRARPRPAGRPPGDLRGRPGARRAALRGGSLRVRRRGDGGDARGGYGATRTTAFLMFLGVKDARAFIFSILLMFLIDA